QTRPRSPGGRPSELGDHARRERRRFSGPWPPPPSRRVTSVLPWEGADRPPARPPRPAAVLGDVGLHGGGPRALSAQNQLHAPAPFSPVTEAVRIPPRLARATATPSRLWNDLSSSPRSLSTMRPSVSTPSTSVTRSLIRRARRVTTPRGVTRCA